MGIVKESFFEEEIVENLQSIGWELLESEKFKRSDYTEVFNTALLKQQLIKINNITDEMADKAIFEINKINDNVLEMNKKGWEILNEGIKIYDPISKLTKNIKVIADDSNLNVYQVIRQFEISNSESTRIPDVVLFINGLPIAVMELKSPLAQKTIEDGFNQNESLKKFSPKLWMFNIFNFISNRDLTLYGSTFANFKRMHRVHELILSKTGEDIIPFLFDPKKIKKFITTFSFFALENNNWSKYMAAPHQIRALSLAVEKVFSTSGNKGGVFWHTQGSGKSVTMLMLAKLIIEFKNNATIIVITDRNDLDKQLYARFLNASDYLRNQSVAIESRNDLIKQLDDKKHFGIYFSTVQKFVEQTGTLTERDDIFVLVDEAHRTQSNLTGERKLSKENEELEIKYGFAKYMRDAFPNAKFLGFTGTPLMNQYERDTVQIFGDLIDTYSMNDAIENEVIVPIYYEMRRSDIKLREDLLEEMDKIELDYRKQLDLNDISSQQKVDALVKSTKFKQILENDEVIKVKSEDIIKHWDKRKQVLHGKAMIVAQSRLAAYKYYKNIITLRPELKDQVILVMTGDRDNRDPDEMASVIVKKQDAKIVAEEFRKANSKYKIAIVVDMWLTGFDVQDLDVLYIDKIIKWHNLMQAIARVNRTYEDVQNNQIKESGLIVDYIGIWKYLSEALQQYASGIEKTVDISIENVDVAREKLNESFEIINDYYIKDIYSFDKLDSKGQYKFIMNAQEQVLSLDTKEQMKFIKLARKVKRFFKMSYAILNRKEAMIAKLIEATNSLLTSHNVQTDDYLQLTIARIKELIKQVVDNDSAEIKVHETKVLKNINEVAEILALESAELEKTNPRVAIEMLKQSIEADLDQLEKFRPIFAKNISEKLKDYISELAKTEDVDKVLNLIKEVAKEVRDKKNEPLEFQNLKLQAFFEILSDDEYLKNNENSQVLRKIAEEVLETIKKQNLDQFHNNPRIKDHVEVELIKLLKNKYNYPPEHLGGISGILINKITKEIKINKNYFRKDE